MVVLREGLDDEVTEPGHARALQRAAGVAHGHPCDALAARGAAGGGAGGRGVGGGSGSRGGSGYGVGLCVEVGLCEE